jgi:hypothetical protein
VLLKRNCSGQSDPGWGRLLSLVSGSCRDAYRLSACCRSQGLVVSSWAMRERGLAGIALLLSGLCFGDPAWAQNDPLSPSDYRWLHENLNVSPESLTLQDLTPSQKSHVYALINTKKLSADKRVMDSADYLYRVNGEDFENTLKRSEELIVAPLPSRD